MRTQTPEFFLLRTPLISIERLLAMLSQDELVAFMQDDLVREAILLASPAFYEQLQAWPAQANDKLRQTALKYALRMGTRCTPFGLFAGCTVGLSAQSTDLNFNRREISRQYRLDMQVLTALSQHINNHPTWRSQIRFWPNPGLYRIGSQLRYTESLKGDQQTHHFISQVEANTLVLQVLTLARNGATVSELAQRISPTEQTPDEARVFIEHLIDDQVLISELTPHVTGPDYFNMLIDCVSQWAGSEALVAPLKEVRTALHPLIGSKVVIESIREGLEKLDGLPSLPKDTVQCDSFFKTDANRISYKALKELQQVLTRVTGLSRLNVSAISGLETFKKEFYARYEEREVPLVVALDSETGIGYGGREDLPFDDSLLYGLFPTLSQSAPSSIDDEVHTLLLRLYTDWLEQGTEEVTLTDPDLVILTGKPVSIPESYYALGYFLASSAEAIDQARYRFVLKGMSGPSAFNLMGRFCQGDPHLTQLVTAHLAQLQQHDSERVHAEIAHLPSPRVGNVIQRPHLQPVEIPYLTRSVLPTDQQILVSDLMVSVPGGSRIILRSKRLGKEIVPRLTTAHSYQSGLPLYRFLCDLQHQEGLLAVDWQWGHLATARRLPRVAYRQLILKEAQWRLHETDWVSTCSDKENVNSWRNRWQIPRLIAVRQADNELFLDLDILICQELLVSTLRRLKTLTLLEWLRTPDNCWINGPDGKLTHEIVIPFINSDYTPPSPVSIPTATTLQRTFLPGSEWVYLNVYSGPKTITNLLQKLGKVAGRMVQEQQISHWFFIRYEDPQPHLRIRFHLTSLVYESVVIQACRKAIEPMSRVDEVSKIQIDTYKRELERYSSALIEQTEWLFWADSRAVFQIHREPLSDDSLFGAGVLGIHALLTDFGFKTTEKAEVCRQSFTALVDNKEANSTLQSTLAQKYRSNQSTIERLLSGKSLSAQENRWLRIFSQRSRHTKSYTDFIISASQQPTGYLPSLIHMFVNRLFSRHQRMYELLLTHHLSRAYQSMSVRRS